MKKLATLAATLLLAAMPTWAQDKAVTLKMSSWVPPAHPLNPSFKAWGEDIEKETGGTVKSTLFPSEQLGKAFDHYDMTRDGIADFAYINPGYQPGRFPVIAAGELPFTSEDAMELVHCHIAKKIAPLDQRYPGIPKTLSDIILKLTSKIAEDRYQSAAEIIRDLSLY